jgi:hypothetical protein
MGFSYSWPTKPPLSGGIFQLAMGFEPRSPPLRHDHHREAGRPLLQTFRHVNPAEADHGTGHVPGPGLVQNKGGCYENATVPSGKLT